MKTQMQMYREAEQRLFDRNALFLEMLSHPTNPITNQDLVKLIALFPARWSPFSPYIGKLEDEVPNV